MGAQLDPWRTGVSSVQAVGGNNFNHITWRDFETNIMSHGSPTRTKTIPLGESYDSGLSSYFFSFCVLISWCGRPWKKKEKTPRLQAGNFFNLVYSAFFFSVCFFFWSWRIIACDQEVPLWSAKLKTRVATQLVWVERAFPILAPKFTFPRGYLRLNFDLVSVSGWEPERNVR